MDQEGNKEPASTRGKRDKNEDSDEPKPAAYHEQSDSIKLRPGKDIQPEQSHVIIDSLMLGASYENFIRNANSFFVQQKVELVEAVLGWESANKYTVRDQSGHPVAYVVEESDCCPRQCGACRPFRLITKDRHGNDLLIFERGFDCSCCLGLFCSDSVSVMTPGGEFLGRVRQKFRFFHPFYMIEDSRGKSHLQISGPFCPISCCGGDVKFRLENLAGAPVGLIAKKWSGLAKELLTDADNFSINFPVDLPTPMKAVCLAALFLIDFHFFEE